MKRCKKFMTLVAALLVFALTFTSVSIPANAATVQSITVTNLPSNTLTLKAGKTFTVKTNVTAGSLKFATSNKKVVTVTSAGKLKAVKNGSAKITVSLKTNARVKKVISVTVGQPVSSVKLNNKAVNLIKGKSTVVKASVGTGKASNKKVIWKSSNTKVAKVNSRGRITAVGGGSAVITAVAADGSGKKASCKVSVKAYVTSIKFKKGSGKMYVGKTEQLNPVIAPADATNKKCTWKSSNDKVAMVSASGLVSAVGTGTTVITATTTDGTKKTAKYKLTVLNAVKIASTQVDNQQTISVTLSSAQKLSASNFAVKVRATLNGSLYNKSIPIESVSTRDNKKYTIKFNKKNMLSSSYRICVYVSGLNGTGTSKAETYYSEGKCNQTYYEYKTFEQNESVNTYIDLYGSGYLKVSVKGVPDGLKYIIEGSRSDCVTFTGAPTKAGTSATTITAVDEYGDTRTTVVTWNVYNSSTISAYYRPRYYSTRGESGSSASIYAEIDSVAGGSGSYVYDIVGNTYGLDIYSNGTLKGYINKAGTYNVRVKITDSNNARVSTTVSCVINVAQGIKVSGYVRDAAGAVLSNAYITFTNKDKSTEYADSYYADVNEDGSYSVDILPGTYDIEISVGSDITYIYSQKFTGNTSGKNYSSDVKKISVRSKDNGYNIRNIGIWYDEEGNSVGSGAYVYLTPGTHKLTGSGFAVAGTITATVNSKTSYVVADIKADYVEIGDKTSINASVGTYYRFVPKTTATYYIYSSSDNDPYGHLYAADGEELTLDDDDDQEHISTGNDYDFYMSYNCEAGKTYYIYLTRDSSLVYITTEYPGDREDTTEDTDDDI